MWGSEIKPGVNDLAEVVVGLPTAPFKNEEDKT